MVVFISEKLKAGQIRGMYQSLGKKEKQQLRNKIKNLVKGQLVNNLVDWLLKEISEGKFQLEFSIKKTE